MKKRTIIYIIGVIVVFGTTAAGGYLYQSNIIDANKAQQTRQEAQDKTTATKKNGITYMGKNGVSALKLLEQNAKIVTSGKGEMAFVTTINDVKANSKNEYWQFNVDGKSATVGAGSYITKNGEVILWKLTSF